MGGLGRLNEMAIFNFQWVQYFLKTDLQWKHQEVLVSSYPLYNNKVKVISFLVFSYDKNNVKIISI